MAKYDTRIVLAWFAAHGLYPEAEFRFHPERKWRFDFLFDRRVALEVQGGIHTAGRHTRGAALLKEYEKLNQAAVLGYRVLFITPDDLCMQDTVDLIRTALAS